MNSLLRRQSISQSKDDKENDAAVADLRNVVLKQAMRVDFAAKVLSGFGVLDSSVMAFWIVLK